MIAVKNNVMAYLKKLPTKYMIINPDKTFLLNIHDMLMNISDPQTSVACASWVANRMPPGKYFRLVYSFKSLFLSLCVYASCMDDCRCLKFTLSIGS